MEKGVFILEKILFQIIAYLGFFLFFLLIGKKVIPDVITEAGNFICKVKKTTRKAINKIKKS
ncbi:MAG: hypothetical protein KAW16_07540 [candidate division Zixibacteria bacterium]|nr:hypothetical protein [candidate division Zixibacteria bacterium]